MSTQIILQRGSDNCSKLEKFADGVLAFPAFLWRGRRLKVNTSGTEPKIIDKCLFKRKTKPENKLQEILSGRSVQSSKLFEVLTFALPGLVALSVVYAGLSILASPFLGVGLAFKNRAINKNPQAKCYHRLLKIAAKDSALKKRMDKLEALNKCINKEINSTNAELYKLAIPEDCTKDVKKLVKEKRKPLLARKEILNKHLSSGKARIAEYDEKWQPIHAKTLEAFEAYKKAC